LFHFRNLKSCAHCHCHQSRVWKLEEITQAGASCWLAVANGKASERKWSKICSRCACVTDMGMQWSGPTMPSTSTSSGLLWLSCRPAAQVASAPHHDMTPMVALIIRPSRTVRPSSICISIARGGRAGSER